MSVCLTVGARRGRRFCRTLLLLLMVVAVRMIAVAATAIAVAVHFDCRNEKVSEYVFLLVHMLNKTAVQVTTARAATAADGESRRHKVGGRKCIK